MCWKAGVSLIAVTFLSACATSFAPPNKFNEVRRLNATTAQTLTAQQQNEKLHEAVEDDYKKALDNCATITNELRKEFGGQREVSLGIATVGIIAGSIIVPSLAAKAAVSKSALAAWGGIAGAANGLQYTLDSNGMSPYQTEQVYDKVVTKIEAAMKAYSAATTPLEKSGAVTSLTVACQFRPLPGVTQSNSPSPGTEKPAEKPAGT